MGGLATLSGLQAAAYKEARPTYPSSWYKTLSDKTTYHYRAWDVGTGNGQAAVGVADYYNNVVATDINQAQLDQATKHPKITYLLTPESMSEDELVALVGGENSVDLVTVAQALHYFDLSKFYAVVKRVLRKPGGVIAVWVFNEIVVSPPVDRVFERLSDSTKPFRTARTDMALAGYKTISFPFESVGIGSEGNPLPIDLPWKLSRDGFLAYLTSWQLVVKAKQQGVDLLPASLIDDFIAAWGSDNVKNVVYKFFMIAGKCKSDDYDWPFQPPGSGQYGPPFPFLLRFHRHLTLIRCRRRRHSATDRRHRRRLATEICHRHLHLAMDRRRRRRLGDRVHLLHGAGAVRLLGFHRSNFLLVN